MATNKRQFRRFFKLHPPQRYFLVLQSTITLATLVFVLSIVLSSMTNAMEDCRMLIGSGEKLEIVFDTMMYSFFTRIVLLFIVVFLLNLLLGLFFLERLTGPLVRIQRVLEEIASGRIPDSDIYLRKHDFPVDLCNALSGAVAYLRKKKAGF